MNWIILSELSKLNFEKNLDLIIQIIKNISFFW